ncbi:MAG: hypothetical protein L0206_22310 [Actinobacteria bacterium]|nr:hypothetical protein [Actinomycetota bacterium]
MSVEERTVTTPSLSRTSTGTAPTAAPAIRPRLAIAVLVVWTLLQLPRLIAVPLIRDVLDDRESDAWLYPAILDVVVAVAAPFVAYALWRKVGLAVWTTAVVFFVVSIVDHGDAVTAAAVAPTPDIFGGLGDSIGLATVPTLQAAIDVVMLLVLTSRRVRSYYLGS